jgi:hypothetical protein
MAASAALTPDAYLRELPPDRAAELAQVRATVGGAMAEGFVETMSHGMIAWVVPLEVAPKTYNGKPLMIAGLAAQKTYSTLHLMPLYSGVVMSEADFRARWSADRAPDLGKGCLRFRSASDLDLSLVTEIVSACTVDGFVRIMTAGRSRR